MSEVEAADAAQPIVSIRGVSKWFGERQVLGDVDLDVQRGEVVVLVGPSGAGKTTLLRTINRLEPIDDGEVRINGELMGARVTPSGKVVDLSTRELARQRADIGFVFQQFNLFPHMSVLENVWHAPVEVKGEKKGDAIARRATRSPLLVSCSSGWASPTRRMRAPARCRAASSSGSRSRAPWRCVRRSCCSTNRRARSTPRWSARCSRSCAISPRAA
jgi:ABC-type glutathione transport system ATPase component